jgi:hypothetical protein
MTTLLPMTEPTVGPEAEAEDATPGCGCCIPPPGAGAKAQVLAELASRRDAIERRLQGLSPRS